MQLLLEPPLLLMKIDTNIYSTSFIKERNFFSYTITYLFQDAIHRIKEVFNKDFEELFVKKEQEISKIKDKNKRIKKIIADLDLVEEVIEPSMGVAEKPETLLTVEDDEVGPWDYWRGYGVQCCWPS